MLKFKLSDAIIEDSHGFCSKHYTYGDWIMIYEWLCRRFITWNTKEGTEILNATSSINNSTFDEIGSYREAAHRIAYMLTCHMNHGVHPFLKYLGINNWADLDNEIVIQGRRPKSFPKYESIDGGWFDMRGRTLNYSPNSSHPNAKWVQEFCIQFDIYNKRWVSKIYYSYPHDGSTWYIDLKQKRGEHLDTYAKRINIWIDSVLVPEKNGRHRIRNGRHWSRISTAWKDIFYEDICSDIYDADKEIANLLIKTQSQHIILNKRKLNTIKKWIGSTK